eukprot:TRINITY_DN12399_c0_g1_i1.p1 TRINITY_DN12399_c0_g1~~TRINITY_DN12399_c0_g1_i1.p1  ORF type:complete len:313 (+),score=45.45 TRINITY_DN12399_c0_g1_i1:1204-2142(+)
MADFEANFVSQTQNPFTNIPLFSKILAIVLIVFHSLSYLSPFTTEYLALNSGYTIPPNFYAWNVITAGFYSSSLYSTALSVVGGLLCSKYLETLWGSRELVKFVILINALSGIATFSVCIFIYFVTLSETILFTPFMGFGAVLAAYTIAIKQLNQDRELLFLFFPVRAKYLPTVFLLGSIPFFFLGSPQPFIVFGMFFAWIYLRFYQAQPGGGYGDMSKEFSFASFFPEFLQGLIGCLSDAVYGVLVACRCCKKHVPYADTDYDFEAVETGEESFDQQRRRAIAAKAIESRMDEKMKIQKQQLRENTSSDNI